MIEILDVTDQRIALYRSLRATPPQHRQESVFVAEGETAVRALLGSSLEIRSVFAVRSFFTSGRSPERLRAMAPDQLFTADKRVMSEIVGFRLHQGIMAIGVEPKQPLLDQLSLPIVALDGIVNSENVGAIVRNCAAFGVKSLLVQANGSSPYMRRAVRVSMGTIFATEVFHTESLPDVLSSIRATRNAAIIAAENVNSALSLSEYDFPRDFVLIIGSERYGVSRDVLEVCDLSLAIPINPRVSSINAAAASAVLLYAASLRAKS